MRTLLLAALATVVVGCSRDDVRVPVRLLANCGTCEVHWRDADGYAHTDSITMTWERTLRLPPGALVTLTACPTDTGVTDSTDINWASVTIWAFANGSPYSFASEGTLWPDSCASFSATVPEP